MSPSPIDLSDRGKRARPGVLRWLALAVALVGLLGLAACGSDDDDTGSGTGSGTEADAADTDTEADADEPSQPMLGTWNLVSIGADDVPDGVTTPTLTIAEGGDVRIHTGCNQGGTMVAIDGDTLTFEPARVTKMACEDPATEVETAVLTVLDGEVQASIDGDELVLTKGDQSLTYERA